MKKYVRALNFFVLVSVMSLGFSYTAHGTVCDPSSLTSARVAYGTRGPSVLNLQLCLLENGYAIPAGATGYYGAQTRTAVKAFYSAELSMPTWDGASMGPVGRAKLAARSAAGGSVTPVSTTAGGFKRVTSEAEFQKYVQASAEQNNYSNALWGLSRGVMTAQGGIVPPAAPVPGAAAGSAAQDNAASTPSRVSDTNVQVAGIDEPDIVKTDGNNIFISQQSPIYTIMSGGVATPPIAPSASGDAPSSMIWPGPLPQGQTLAVSAFPLSSLGIASKDIKEQGEMLLVKDKKILVIFSQPNIVGYDISDPKKPVKKWSSALGDNTSIVTSRLKDGNIYLVTQAWINQSSPCAIVQTGIHPPMSCTDIWVPNSIEPVNTIYTIATINPVTGYVSNKLGTPTGEGSTNTISIAGDSNNTIVSVSENNIYLTYRSQTAMTGVLIDFYLTKLTDFLPAATIARIQTINSYDISSASKLNEAQIAINAATAGMTADARLKFDNEVQNRLSSYLDVRARDIDRSVIARIPLSTLTIAATGMIPGHLLNQFSLDEYRYPAPGVEFSHPSLAPYDSILRVAVTVGDQWGIGSGKTKNDVYVLDNKLQIAGSIKDLGIGERIYAARFIGDRGYLVTFRQTDPFYVLDLTYPWEPKMAGQLKIPGYSAYLEPLSDTLVLGVGREGSQVKLSVFDVSNPQNPVEKSKYTLKEGWTEVEQNHHAFLRDPLHSVFFIPGGNGGYVFSYENGNLTLKATHSDYTVRRAVYIDNYLYVIGDSKIAVFDETTWTKVKELSLQ